MNTRTRIDYSTRCVATESTAPGMRMGHALGAIWNGGSQPRAMAKAIANLDPFQRPSLELTLSDVASRLAFVD
jgi:hypothetical protein